MKKRYLILVNLFLSLHNSTYKMFLISHYRVSRRFDYDNLPYVILASLIWVLLDLNSWICSTILHGQIWIFVSFVHRQIFDWFALLKTFASLTLAPCLDHVNSFFQILDKSWSNRPLICHISSSFCTFETLSTYFFPAKENNCFVIIHF